MASLLASSLPIDVQGPERNIEIVNVANSIASGQGFGNPYGCMTGLTAHLAPVFPYLMGLTYWMFPSGLWHGLSIRILRITLVSLVFAMLPWLAVKLRLPYRTGVLAGLAGAAIPVYFWIEVREDWEGPLSALLLIVGLGLFADLFDRANIRRAAAAGVTWGVALLTTPTMLLTFAAIAGFWLWRCRRRIAVQWGLIPALLLPIALILLPWTIRNYLIFHQVFFVRQNMGIELHVSFNSLAGVTLADNILSGGYRDHPTLNTSTCMEFARRGEVEMNRVYLKQGLDWIRANPGRSTQLVAKRFIAFWRMVLAWNHARTLITEALTAAGLIGLWLCFLRHRFAAQLLGLVLLTYPLSYYIVHFDTRYRYPLHPIIVLLTCVFVTEIVTAIRSGVSERRGKLQSEPMHAL